MRLITALVFINLLTPFIAFAQDWQLINEVAPDAAVAIEDNFGVAIHVDGDYAFIGADKNDSLEYDAGIVFIYHKINNAWEFVTSIYPETTRRNLRFGFDIDVYENFLVVGTNSLSGSVFVFENVSEDWAGVIQRAELTPRMPDSGFGKTISINSNTIAVGSSNRSTESVNNAGAVYIYDRPESGWTDANESYLLTPSNSQRFSNFGEDVDLNGDTLAVSAPTFTSVTNPSQVGSVYIFERDAINKWHEVVESAQILTPTTQSFQKFGSTISLSNGFIVISSPWEQVDDHLHRGIVYVFEKSGPDWANLSSPIELHPSQSEALMDFGTSIISSNSSIAVSDKVSNHVYVFNRPAGGSWVSVQESAHLTKSHGESNGFGFSFGINNETILVGAPFENSASTSGCVYSYSRESAQWEDLDESQVLHNTFESSAGANFGRSISTHGKYAVVGCPDEDSNGSRSGAAYVFEYVEGIWIKRARLLPSNGQAHDRFGYSVDIFNDHIIVSAPYRDSLGTFDLGMGYIFKKHNDGWRDATEDFQLSPADASETLNFGHDVEINNEYAFLSSSKSSKIYIFEKSTDSWSSQPVAVLSNPHPPSNDKFGHSFAIYANDLLTGAYAQSFGVGGKVYVFTMPESGWSNNYDFIEITDPENDHQNSFGRTVAIDKNYLAINSNLFDGLNDNTGIVYLYQKVNGVWSNTPIAEVKPPNPTRNDSYGNVSLSGNHLAISSMRADYSNGLVHLYKKEGEQWISTDVPNQTIQFTPFSLSGFDNGNINRIELTGTSLMIGLPVHDSQTGYKSGSVQYLSTTVQIDEVSSENLNGNYRYNENINIQIYFSDPVEVSGAPRLLLELENRVAQADYISGSGTEVLTFQYSVHEDDFSQDLSYTSINAIDLSNGEIYLGTAGSLVLDLPSPGEVGSLSYNKDLQINGRKSRVLNVFSPNENKTYFLGDTVYINVVFNNIVSVTEVPHLALALENRLDSATYLSGSGSTILQFRYVVALNDFSADLGYNGSMALTGSITATDSSYLDLNLPEPGIMGSLSFNNEISIDGIGVGIEKVNSISPDGTYFYDDQVIICVHFNEPVDVVGEPRIYLQLENGEAFASYLSGSGSDVLHFLYRVEENDSTDRLGYNDVNAMDLSAGNITSHNPLKQLITTLPTPNQPGSLQYESDISIDGEVIRVTQVYGNSGTYYFNNELIINVAFSNTVIVDGIPSIELQLNDNVRNAVYYNGSGTNTLQFKYEVNENDSSSNLNYLDVKSLRGGNFNIGQKFVDRVLPFPGTEGSLSQTSQIVINGRILKIVNVTSPNKDGTYFAGDQIIIDVHFSNKYLIIGFPKLILKLDNRLAQADYITNDGLTNIMSFSYEVQNGDLVPALSIDSSTDLKDNIEVFADADEFYLPYNLDLPLTGDPGSLLFNKTITIDAVEGSIEEVFIEDPEPSYTEGDEIVLGLKFTSNVEVVGTPSLMLALENRNATAMYFEGSGTPLLKFLYTVKAGDNTGMLEYSNAEALQLNGGSIVLSNGNELNLKLPEPGSKGSISSGTVTQIITSEVVTSAELALSEVLLYPNPIKDKLIVKSGGDIDRIKIFNSHGIEVFEQFGPALNMEIDVSHIPSGKYIIAIETYDNVHIFHHIRQ